ncbi:MULTISPECIES: hypothetical protein [unclassified Streptomyces]|uniref:hypothetical protein n=1 Tax=unclassified Streptomyces TaxID=2593676 RepID=UPI002DDA2A18|nr:hypothetical protein [Streptomyces sp. NBC_01750]WSA98303.1 hypothetical protein OIE54_02995 [Streptomyces sp. NBC_01794]WSD37159.1 hypothetical protein OG966_37790 [Streptomyces sp. NBC_01750]
MTPRRSTDTYDVKSTGSGSLTIGKVGRVVLSLFAGDVSEFSGRAKRWSGWNWPPFFLVLALGATALIAGPSGPARQFVWVYAAIGTAVVLSFCRVVGVVGDSRSPVPRALVQGSALLLAVLGLVGMDHLAEHGEIDVTGRTHLSPSGPMTRMSAAQIVVDGPAQRSWLRLTVAVEDADPLQQSCTPESELTLQLIGGSNTGRVEGVRAGMPVELPLGGSRTEVRVQVALSAEEGCLLAVSVASAAFHD